MNTIFKKIWPLALVASLLTATCLPLQANMADKLQGHWAHGLLREEILSGFFPKFIQNDYQLLEPQKEISTLDTISALNLLYQKFDKNPLTYPVESSPLLLRKDILDLLIPSLEDENKNLPPTGQALTYSDCQGLSPRQAEILQILTDRGILRGVSTSLFAPNQPMTQSELMILVQRLYDRLDQEGGPKTKEQVRIPFLVLPQVAGLKNQEGYWVETNANTLILTITKEFSTGGYSIGVKQVMADQMGIWLDLEINSPGIQDLVTMAFSYPTVRIEIKKDDLPINTPLKFHIQGLKTNTDPVR